MLACFYGDSPCEFLCYEDGFSSYVIDYLRRETPINRFPETLKICEKISAVLLYEPCFAMRGDDLPNHPLPKIHRNDTSFREVLNFIFDYQPPRERPDFLFLEQSFGGDQKQ